MVFSVRKLPSSETDSSIPSPGGPAQGKKRAEGTDYELIDSGNGRKFERFGKYRLIRPCAQAIWRPRKEPSLWSSADATFDRVEGNRWQRGGNLPEEWTVTVSGICFRLSATDFGHLGIFPEQRDQWTWIARTLEHARENLGRTLTVLNLFAYSGGSTLAAAKTGAEVWHVDASKGMVKWARENADLNGLACAPIHWVVEDVNRYLDREIRRGKNYDAIILDPPTFGHGRRKEVYKIDEELTVTLEKCWALMSRTPVFILLTSHTPYCTPMALANFLQSVTGTSDRSRIEYGEMLLTGGGDVLPVPSGTYARWLP
jgi:23S rRNA (cytosine1962-C5)-methyltransferase